MTNREWINTLSDEEFIETISSCYACAYQNTECWQDDHISCSDGKIKWLKQEHKENEK